MLPASPPFAPLSRSKLIELALFAAVVAFCAWAGVVLTLFTGRIAVVWVANAVAAAYILKSDRRDFLPLLVVFTLADMAGDALTGDRLVSMIVAGLCNTLEVTVLVVLLRRYARNCDFTAARTLTLFYLIAVGPATLAAALCAGVWLYLDVHAPFLASVSNWYLGDTLGLIILMPLLMTARVEEYASMFARRHVLGTVIGLAGLGLTIAINGAFPNYPFAYLFFPPILLLTFTRGLAGGTLGTLAADAYLLAPALGGHAHTLVHRSLREQLMIILGFSAVLSFTLVLTGAALAHRRRLERGLAEALTHAEEAREEAVAAKHAAENANRSKSMFLANMSHELRTPLNAVIGFSEVMSAEMFGPLGHTRYRDYAGLIHGAGAHLLDLINDILDMSKIEAGKFEIEKVYLDGRSVIDDCLKLMQERADTAKVKLVRDVPSAPLTLYADRRALKQIVLNLLSNAVKFTPEGGQVSVHLEADPLRGRCRLRVSDTGVGIPAEAISRLGNPFVQARGGVATTHQGTGLGLALVRALSQMHDGVLKIESVLGVGTIVTVDMPTGTLAEAAA